MTNCHIFMIGFQEESLPISKYLFVAMRVLDACYLLHETRKYTCEHYLDRYLFNLNHSAREAFMDTSVGKQPKSQRRASELVS